MTPYQIKAETGLSFAEVVAGAKSALAKEGFGVLTEIDVRATLKEKLGAAWEPYVIIGACNPSFAYQALQSETDIGLMLPCNLIVYARGGKTFVAAIRPSVAMGNIGNPALTDIARQVEERLVRVVAFVAQGASAAETAKATE